MTSKRNARAISRPTSAPRSPASCIARRTVSGMVIPGTSLWRNSAWRGVCRGRMPGGRGGGGAPGAEGRGARARIVATMGWTPSQRQDVADAEPMAAEDLRLEGHDVPVAGREVDKRLEADLVLHREGHGQAAHAHARHRRVADVHEVDAGGLEQAGAPARARAGGAGRVARASSAARIAAV